MSDPIEDFLSAPEVERFAPASESEVHQHQKESGLLLPPSLARFYRASNGARLEELNLTLVPLAESLKYVDGFRRWGLTERWGYFAFTDANDSNPHCICCNATAIQGHVVLVRHDDNALLTFRSVESFLNTVLQLARLPDDPLIDDLKNDYGSHGNQNDADVAAGISLIAEADNLPDDNPDRIQMYQFGIALLPDEQIVNYSRLLDGNSYLRECMLERLRTIPTLSAKTLISTHLRARREFCLRAVEAIRNAGIHVETVKGETVLIQPNHAWIALDTFFEDREQPDVLIRVVKAARDSMTRK